MTMERRSPLHTSLPWISSPLIANAPMGGTAGPPLATAVSSAAGLGLMGMDPTASALDKWLDEAETFFSNNPIPLATAKHGGEDPATRENAPTTASLPYLPTGVGFLVSFTSLSQVTTSLSRRATSNKKPPAILWLFAAAEPSIDTYTSWATGLRKVYASYSYTPQIWIQTGGSAQAAIDLAISDARPDALIVQGNDAGGHGMERGASVMSLVPEVHDLLKSTFSQRSDGRLMPTLLASGGIVDSRGVLAALSLGAEGVVMGTRFLASPETGVPHPEYRKRVLAARDGGMSTIRAKVFDELRGPNVWPEAYDGRALVNQSWKDMYEGGVGIEVVRERHGKAAQREDRGYGLESGRGGDEGASDRAAIWAGSGVGLVNEIVPAGDVVRSVRYGVKKLLGEVIDRASGSTGARL